MWRNRERMRNGTWSARGNNHENQSRTWIAHPTERGNRGHEGGYAWTLGRNASVAYILYARRDFCSMERAHAALFRRKRTRVNGISLTERARPWHECAPAEEARVSDARSLKNEVKKVPQGEKSA